jgi:hypothetical protein
MLRVIPISIFCLFSFSFIPPPPIPACGSPLCNVLRRAKCDIYLSLFSFYYSRSLAFIRVKNSDLGFPFFSVSSVFLQFNPSSSPSAYSACSAGKTLSVFPFRVFRMVRG